MLRRGRILAITAGVYGLLLIAILLMRLLIGERWVISAVLISGLHLLLMPSLVLLPLCLLRGLWRPALLVAPAFVTFLANYAAFFLPQMITIDEGARQISLLTYNLHAEEFIFEPLAEVIRDANADVVALQELSGAASASFNAALADLYPHRALHPVSFKFHGRGILSRYPIVEDYAWPEEYPIPVRLQRAVLDINGTALTVYNMHSPPSYPVWGEGYDIGPRAQQIGDLLALAEQDSGAVILMGDFNTTDMDENYARITARFADIFREVGWGMGFTNPDTSHENSREGPFPWPLYTRLDYVFHNDALQPVEAHVWPTSGGSDHRPLFARLALASSSQN
jgi:vancomycin resistance protein VanJ